MGRKISFLTKIMAVVMFCAVMTASANSGDKFVDDYEHFMTKYIQVLKKVQAGDLSVMAQMMEFQAEVMQWTQNVETELPKLTPKQAARLKELGEKFAKELGSQ